MRFIVFGVVRLDPPEIEEFPFFLPSQVKRLPCPGQSYDCLAVLCSFGVDRWVVRMV